MSVPFGFDSTTRRFHLPLLFAGQAQKEFFVNEALTRLDLFMQCVVEDEVQVPPAAPVLGQCWLVGDAPGDDFAGHAGEIAGWTGSGWRFLDPIDGLRAFDRSRGSFRLFHGTWRHAEAPAAPSGGTVIDQEARAVLAELLRTLTDLGICAAS